MKNMNKLGCVAPGLGLAAFLTACSVAPSEAPAPTPAVTAVYDYYRANAAAARAAIAQGYDTCKITEVVSDSNSKEATERHPNQYGRRGMVNIRVSAHKTDESEKYEIFYNDNSTVNWSPTTLDGRISGDSVLQPQQDLEAPEAPEAPQKLFPRFDYRVGTEMGVYLETRVETIDFRERKHHKVTGATYCGSLALRENAEGEREWRLNPDAPALSNEYTPVTCNLVPNPNQTPPEIVTFHTEC